MSFDEKVRCLFCGEVVRPFEDARVMAAVLIAHARCLPGARQ